MPLSGLGNSRSAGFPRVSLGLGLLGVPLDPAHWERPPCRGKKSGAPPGKGVVKVGALRRGGLVGCVGAPGVRPQF